jgi:phenylpyruvate tautomerase PptA (4-oxalocrotonate tautomerase family)
MCRRAQNGALSCLIVSPTVIQGAEASRNHPINKRKRYENIQRSSDCIFTQLTLNEGRAVEQKQRFYKAVVDDLHRGLSLRREDVFIKLVEVTKENWSFGKR